MSCSFKCFNYRINHLLNAHIRRVDKHGILSLLGVIIGAGGFWLAFRTAPAWGAAAGFWVMNLAGTALAYLLTMRRKFLESNLGRE